MELHEGTGKYEGLVHDGKRWLRPDADTGELVAAPVGFWQKLRWHDKGIILCVALAGILIVSYFVVDAQRAVAIVNGETGASQASTIRLIMVCLWASLAGVVVCVVASIVAAIMRARRP